jgi:hypothetical protein
MVDSSQFEVAVDRFESIPKGIVGLLRCLPDSWLK